MKILFVCSANVDRSPTAERIYKDCAGLEVKSAGVGSHARQPVIQKLLEWADVILCMEKRHKQCIVEDFTEIVSRKKIDSLEIEDMYHFMQPTLIALIKAKTDAWLHENHIEFGDKINKGVNKI